MPNLVPIYPCGEEKLLELDQQSVHHIGVCNGLGLCSYQLTCLTALFSQVSTICQIILPDQPAAATSQSLSHTIFSGNAEIPVGGLWSNYRNMA